MLPELSVTSLLTVAVYRVLAAGLAGIDVSVLTLISVPEGIVVWPLRSRPRSGAQIELQIA